MMKHSLLAALAVASLGLVGSLDAHAQDRRVIQNRMRTMQHEFTLELGILPLDVLYKAPTLTGRYTWHINDFVAWEVLSLSYAPTTDLSLLGLGVGPVRLNHFTSQGNDLQDNFGFTQFDVDQMRMFAESNVVIKPLYGKFSLFNRANARIELFGVGGVAVANFVAYHAYPPDPLAIRGVPPVPTTPTGFLPQPGQTFLLRPGLDVGGGFRWFLGNVVSFRLDARAYGFLEGYNGFIAPKPNEFPTLPLGITQVFYLGLGTSFNFGGAS